MHIEHEVKLNYDDVLIRKRSTLGSRKEVDLERGFTYPNYEPIPIIIRFIQRLSAGPTKRKTLSR